MKLWIKYALASIIGILLGSYLFPTTTLFYQQLEFARQVVLNIGRYVLLPLFFFSLTYAAYKLRMERRILAVLGKSVLIVLVSSVILMIVGTAAVLLLDPERIPILVESEHVPDLPGVQEILLALFPANLFKIFVDSGDFLLPLVFFALFLGLNFSFDKVLTRPAVQLFESLSRVFYHMAKFLNEILGLGIVVLAGFFVSHIRLSDEIELYSQLILLLGLLTAFIVLGLYPALLYYFTGKRNPYKLLYAIAAPAVAAFFSGNSYFAMVPLTGHVKENLGVPRKVGAVTLPLFTLLSKAGTAMVTSITFVVILKSYSSLGIGFSEILWIMSFSLLISLLTSATPGLGVIAALAAIAGLYGRGIEEGFLIVYPILPILNSFAVFLDTITSGLGSLVVSYSEDNQKEIYAKDFI